MKWVVMGAGAVGGYFGGRLAQAGYPVQFLVRPRRFGQLMERGLRVRSVHGDFAIAPEATTDPAAAAEGVSVVMLAVKNYHLDDTIPALDTLVAAGADVLPVGNGVEHFEQLRRRYGPDRVLGGTCLIETTLDESGDVVQTSPMHELIFGPLPGDTAHQRGGPRRARLEELQTALRASGVQVTLTDEAWPAIWMKYLFLTAFSGLTAAVRSPIGEILADRETRSLLQDVLEEGRQVAVGRGVPLPPDAVEQIMARVTGLHPTMTSSLHRDLQKGLPLEVDSLQGAWVRMAAEVGVPSPLMRTLYAVLHPHRDGGSGA
ncbi:MAG: ketopantoate reductase family protein [Alicyclobacillus sp.]|nr:ketopantoate reductase family protein [Alicyclobacillus sp.]